MKISLINLEMEEELEQGKKWWEETGLPVDQYIFLVVSLNEERMREFETEFLKFLHKFRSSIRYISVAGYWDLLRKIEGRYDSGL